MAECSSVQIAPDSTGKNILHFKAYTIGIDGSQQDVFAQEVCITDAKGRPTAIDQQDLLFAILDRLDTMVVLLERLEVAVDRTTHGSK